MYFLFIYLIKNMNISIQYVLTILIHKILHQNENDLSLEVKGRQVVFWIEIALYY